MGASCGCKSRNVVQPSPIKTATAARLQQQQRLRGPDLVIMETTDGLSTTDSNNNNNVNAAKKNVSKKISEQSVLKKYEMQTIIGEGSFSKVFRVQNRQSKEFYALKITDKAKSLESGMPSYKRELAILKRTNHSNIIKLYEVFYSNSEVYLILELALGGDLFDRLSSNGPYNEPLARSTVTMVTEGLRYLHQHNITHRDLKLENLIYKNSKTDSKILISDFGLSHVTDDVARGSLMYTTCGSDEYIAPEVLDGCEYTHSVDMWALGVITYAVLSGHMPFMETNRARLHSRIRSGLLVFKEQVRACVCVCLRRESSQSVYYPDYSSGRYGLTSGQPLAADKHYMSPQVPCSCPWHTIVSIYRVISTHWLSMNT